MTSVKNVLRSSTHWRITSPLRFVGYQFARGKHLLKIMPAAFQVGGGFFSTLMKAANLFCRDGLSGVKRGIRFVQTAPCSAGVDRNDYAEWVRRYDTIDSDKRKKLAAICENLTQLPKISIIMPTYNPDLAWLVQAIESVCRQIYPNWELCIADDASTNPEVRRVLEQYAHVEARIKVTFREINGHISAASNSALAMVTGTWVALLDHDDLLPEHALVLISQAINDNRDAGLIYSDEDKIDDQGNRTSPYFKCDLNLELLRAQNMISHLGVYRRDLVESVGGFRIGFEGSQDYDLALRVIDLIMPDQVVHVPHVLYHWRIHAASTAMDAGAKTYAQDAGLKALNEHLQRCAVVGSVELTPFFQYRIRYATPPGQPLVSLIIPTRNGLHQIRQCVSSILRKTTYSNFEILIVDNGSDDLHILQYFSEIIKDSRIRVIRDDSPFNYSALNNRAVALARGEFVGLLNNDIEVITPGWLEEMLSLAALPGNGAVGARLWYPDDTLQHGGVVLGLGGVAGHVHKRLPRGHWGYFGRGSLTHGVSCVTAACLLIRKSIYLAVGGLNDSDLRVAFNDIDFCLKVRAAGYQNIWTPFAELYHHESATRGKDDTSEKQQRFAGEVAYMQSSWGEHLLMDPAYNPNLTLEYEDFSLAWPPRVEICWGDGFIVDHRAQRRAASL
jgi:glycosyltransferase involved in cell wall biosynthesis